MLCKQVQEGLLTRDSAELGAGGPLFPQLATVEPRGMRPSDLNDCGAKSLSINNPPKSIINVGNPFWLTLSNASAISVCGLV